MTLNSIDFSVLILYFIKYLANEAPEFIDSPQTDGDRSTNHHYVTVFLTFEAKIIIISMTLEGDFRFVQKGKTIKHHSILMFTKG